ncbi:MAG: hypothetical protein KAJ19_05620, partial [Gammaproteobacteria bacterium]|nr:hypothetical protein [Gammaproteobacteria bacterium]
MPLTQTSIASKKVVGTIEKSFVALAQVLASKGILAGGFDPAKTGIAAGTPYIITSASHAATLFGEGSQLHRMAIYFFKTSLGSVQVTAFPLPAAAGGVAATKTITFATNVDKAGSFILRAGGYLIGEEMKSAFAVDATPTEVAAAFEALITANTSLPFTAVAAIGVLTLTAKTLDITGEDLQVTMNQKTEEAELLPGAMTAVIADDVSGVGQSVLTGLWTYLAGTEAGWMTDVITPYADTAALDGALNVGGNPNDESGNYDPLDYRPFSSYTGDTDGDQSALTAAIALGNGRKNTDVIGCRVAAPTYPEQVYEIASNVAGKIALLRIINPAKSYEGMPLSDLYGPLVPANDWTINTGDPEVKPYQNLNAAAIAGITPIIFREGVPTLGDVTSFWHPDDNQNAPFKYVCNQTKIWNLQLNYSNFLNGEDLKRRPIVNNLAATK